MLLRVIIRLSIVEERRFERLIEDKAAMAARAHGQVAPGDRRRLLRVVDNEILMDGHPATNEEGRYLGIATDWTGFP